MEGTRPAAAATSTAHSNSLHGSYCRSSVFEEAYDLTVIACATHFLGRMRLEARKVVENESEDTKERITDNKPASQATASAFPKPVAESVLEVPIAPCDIANAIDSRGEGAISFLDDKADFDRERWSSVNKEMLGVRHTNNSSHIRSSLRTSLSDGHHSDSPQTWRIVEYDDERSEEELVYAIYVDDVKRRVVVSFRASVTLEDWKANMNWLYGVKKNPVAGTDLDCGRYQLPKKMVMHRGFRNYLFQKEGDKVDEEEDEEYDEDESFSFAERPDKVRKIYSILENAAKVLRDNPSYRLYTSGYSLGAGLATIFSLYAAAASDNDIPKPVTCVTIGSPKCGTLSFRKSFETLEQAGKLRYLRIMNEHDPIKLAPFKPPNLEAALLPGVDYRHVGMALFLREGGGFSFDYPRLTNHYFKICCDDLYKQTLNCISLCIICFDQLSGKQSPSQIGDHHGYAEYMHRLKMNRDKLRELDLDELYRTAWERRVPFHFLPCCFPPPDNKNGEMYLHYF